jgi:CTP:molybdopterin cytidylyltransferase MocA
MIQPGVTGVLLAAGGGARMGLPKALLHFAGGSLVDHAVQVLRDGECDEVVVVLGAAADAVPRPAGSVIVVNGDWHTGLASSLRCGLAAATGGVAVVTLVDQPGISAAAVARLLAAHRPEIDAATVATYRGQLGHPVVLDRRIWSAVLARSTGDAGARGWLRAHPEQVAVVPCDDVADPADLDTPEDLAALDDQSSARNWSATGRLHRPT